MTCFLPHPTSNSSKYKRVLSVMFDKSLHLKFQLKFIGWIVGGSVHCGGRERLVLGKGGWHLAVWGTDESGWGLEMGDGSLFTSHSFMFT